MIGALSDASTAIINSKISATKIYNFLKNELLQVNSVNSESLLWWANVNRKHVFLIWERNLCALMQKQLNVSLVKEHTLEMWFEHLIGLLKI